MIADALNVSGANNESEEKDYQPHCFPVAASWPLALLPQIAPIVIGDVQSEEYGPLRVSRESCTSP